MLSGGYDSAGVLFWALGHPDWHVRAHHIEIVNYERRHEGETAAIHDIEVFLKKSGWRGWITRSKIENLCFPRNGYDILHVGLWGAIIADGILKQSPSQFMTIEVFTGAVQAGEAEADEVNARTRKADRIFRLYFEGRNLLVWPRLSHPFENTPKKEVIKYIPAELLPRLFTCRRPLKRDGKVFECGICRSCQRKNEALEIARG
jgi:hypothetical protein